MKDYKKFFKGKKITVMGLGLLGRGLGYTKFLAECGADLIVTDLKDKDELATSIASLKKFQNPRQGGAGIQYVLGEHRLEDFKDRDMVIKAAGVPLDSIYIKEAKKNNIPVEMDVSLFIKAAPKIKVVGVTGTRGKSMTTMLIYHILKENINSVKSSATPLRTKKPAVFLGGNIRGVATLPFLKKVEPGDILVAELDSWQLQGFGDSGISPNISVFTNFMQDHMNYYKDNMKKYFADKANIFMYQKKGDVLVVTEDVKKRLPKEIKSKVLVAKAEHVEGWDFIVPGEHQRLNLACAVLAAEAMGISKTNIRKAVASFKGVEGRLQLLRTYKYIKIYNDNNATTPKATIAGIKSVAFATPDKFSSTRKGNLFLIFGGADKRLFLGDLVKAINKNCSMAFAIPGTGTDRLKNNPAFNKLKKIKYVKNLEEAVSKALEFAKEGDTILFSPAFASFGAFKNEYERNDLFVKIVKGLK